MILSHKKHGTKNHSHKTPVIVAILDLCYTVMNASAQDLRVCLYTNALKKIRRIHATEKEGELLWI